MTLKTRIVFFLTLLTFLLFTGCAFIVRKLDRQYNIGIEEELDDLLYDWRNSKLLESIEHGDAEAVRKQISKGANVNYYTRNGGPLYYAIEYEQPEICKILIDAGADVITDGEDFLEMAIEQENPEICRILLEAGVDANIGWFTYPLDDAIYRNQPEICRILIEFGADVNRTERYLVDAIKENQPEICKILLDAGADPNVWASDDRTLLELAIDKNNSYIVDMLLDAEVDPGCFGWSHYTIYKAREVREMFLSYYKESGLPDTLTGKDVLDKLYPSYYYWYRYTLDDPVVLYTDENLTDTMGSIPAGQFFLLYNSQETEDGRFLYEAITEQFLTGWIDVSECQLPLTDSPQQEGDLLVERRGPELIIHYNDFMFSQFESVPNGNYGGSVWEKYKEDFGRYTVNRYDGYSYDLDSFLGDRFILLGYYSQSEDYFHGYKIIDPVSGYCSAIMKEYKYINSYSQNAFLCLCSDDLEDEMWSLWTLLIFSDNGLESELLTGIPSYFEMYKYSGYEKEKESFYWVLCGYKNKYDVFSEISYYVSGAHKENGQWVVGDGEIMSKDQIGP